MKKYTHNPQSLKEWNALAKERKRLRMLSIQESAIQKRITELCTDCG